VYKPKHIVLTSHPGRKGAKSIPIHWGESDPLQRGLIIATLTKATHRNAIGTHSGSYSVYRALAIASSTLQADHRPDFTNTSPAEQIGPHPSWGDPHKIVCFDPFGAIDQIPDATTLAETKGRNLTDQITSRRNYSLNCHCDNLRLYQQ
jgi:GTP cyclohydrolase N terminal